MGIKSGSDSSLDISSFINPVKMPIINEGARCSLGDGGLAIMNSSFKKIFIFLGLIVFSAHSIFAQDSWTDSAESDVEEPLVQESPVPLLLEGIWENYSRYVVFDTGYVSPEGESVPHIVLRTFYQWYDDRTAESTDYSATHPRDTNNTTQTSSQAQEVKIRFVPLTDQLFTSDYGITTEQEDGDILIAENLCSGAWDMQVEFGGKRLGGKKIYHIPVAVIGDKLYLKFAIKVEDSDSLPVSPFLNGTVLESGNKLAGYWQDFGNANGIFASPPRESEELLSYYVTDDAVYPIRYWKTDMEYDSSAVATFSDGGEIYSLPKHLWVGGQNYACTLGRRTEIRNLQKQSSLPEPHTVNSVLVEKHSRDNNGNPVQYTVRTTTICAFGEPYLTLTDGTRTIEEIIAMNHQRRKPAPKPLFPPHGILDFDWSIVERPPKDFNRRVLDLGK